MKILSGNEAIAQGAIDAGVKVGTGYPGTPSTEALENFAKSDDVIAQWCTNEKVAYEVALGASAAGARSIVTMKHVGLNVAADPLFTSSYTGVNGGMVVFVADDPGMHSSQNEQDSHFYAKASMIPMMDPADSQEAYDMAREAFDLSEEFDVPFLIRSSVRISHTRTPVELKDCNIVQDREYETDPSKWVMMPLYAKVRRVDQLKRTDDIAKWVETCKYNRIESRDKNIGIVCLGATYQYVRDALPNASVFKLGISFPLPKDSLTEFASSVDKLYVIEEASSYLEDSVKALGIEVCDTPSTLPKNDELSPTIIRQAFDLEQPNHIDADISIPGRPPALCSGCPHRVVFKELSRIKAIVTGDIGCYTLGALPPLSEMDICVDMGASISMAHGMNLAFGTDRDRPVAAIIGDSTFAHSGISSLMTTSYNLGSGIICILDNRTTAMTGRQGNPFNGEGMNERPARQLDIESVVKALGIEDVETIDPNDVNAVRASLKSARDNKDDLSVRIFKRPCVLLERVKETPYFVADCTACGVCLTLGCPSIGKDLSTGQAYIDAESCIGCGQCAQYCKFDAIVSSGR